MCKGVLIVKATGIVRRLDDLGRLVIPKEIRKQYRLKEGDSIEFFIEGDKIVIQKYDVLSRHMEEIEGMVQTLESMYETRVLFIQEEWIHTHKLEIRENFMKVALVHRPIVFEKTKIFEQDEDMYGGKIFPIVSYGDWIGSLVVIFDQEISEDKLIAAEAFSKYLTRQQEQ